MSRQNLEISIPISKCGIAGRGAAESAIQVQHETEKGLRFAQSATSREVLRIEGEYIYRVPPLHVPTLQERSSDNILGYSAVQLFIARMKALDHDFTPSDENLATIAAICRRLDGIPLAIEFAAARAATLGI